MTEQYKRPPLPDDSGGAAMHAAVAELTEISRLRSEAHLAANVFHDFHVHPGDNREHRLRRQLGRAQSALARWALVSAHRSFRTVDLARVENDGDWSATDEVERHLEIISHELKAGGRSNGLLPRQSLESRLRITIDPTMVSALGLVAVRRKRMMLATQPISDQFPDVRPYYNVGTARSSRRGGKLTADEHIEIDKVSEFVLDVGELLGIDRRTQKEVLGIVSSRTPTEITRQVPSLRLPTVIQQAVDDRAQILIPAVTTYYAHRKYANVVQLGGEAAEEQELARK